MIKIEEDSDRYTGTQESEEFVIFNPLINYLPSEKQGFWEGCLSVPGLRGYVERPRKLKINYLNERIIDNKWNS